MEQSFFVITPKSQAEADKSAEAKLLEDILSKITTEPVEDLWKRLTEQGKREDRYCFSFEEAAAILFDAENCTKFLIDPQLLQNVHFQQLLIFATFCIVQNVPLYFRHIFEERLQFFFLKLTI